MQHERQLEQTRWLLDAGIARASSQLKNNTGYDGETWIVTPSLGPNWISRIEIAVMKSGSEANATRINVTAEIRGNDSLAHATRRSHSFLVALSQDKNDRT
ncbi:hypothetical protein [Planctomycetes bacterium CA13]